MRRVSLNNKRAFTMLELVMVIVILGILTTLALPRLERDYKQEASDTILSDIRYTQHLALMDHKQRFNELKWQRAFWQISFEGCANETGLFMTIGSDSDYGGDINKEESATDPSNGKAMFWKNTDSCEEGGDGTVSDSVFISRKFGITDVVGSGGCSDVQYIGFDHLGRPHVGFKGSDKPDYSSYMSQDCTFTFTLSDNDTFSIKIEKETGYAYIIGEEDF